MSQWRSRRQRRKDSLFGSCRGAVLVVALLVSGGVAIGQEDTQPRTPEEAARVAFDAFLLPEQRLEAISELAVDRSKKSAEALIGLIDPSQSPQIRNAAFAGLARLSGLDQVGPDPAAWQQWWDQNRQMNDVQWYRHLLTNLSRSKDEVVAHQQWTEQRLIDAHRKRYEALADGRRSAALLDMLGDQLTAIRLLAMELMENDLVEQSIPSMDLVVALREHLADPSAQMRRRAALLLKDLGDQGAADLVAARLVAGQEKSPQVLEAHLLLLTRMVRAAAVQPALKMLDDAELAAKAAGFLAAAADESLLSPAYIQDAAALCRAHLEAGSEPEPEMVALLGRVGNEVDWTRISQWLDSPEEATREAAALAWNHAGHPMLALAKRSGDPAIGSIALAAAVLRGDDLDSLLALIANLPPQRDASNDRWAEAMAAMAGRLGGWAVLEADQKLAAHEGELALRLLSVAIEAIDSGDSQLHGPLPDLLLRRAELRLEGDDPQGAVADYQRVSTSKKIFLNSKQRRRAQGGQLHGLLETGDVEGAVDLARTILKAPPPQEPVISSDTFVAEVFLLAAGRHLESEQFDRTAQILDAVPTLLQDRIPQQVRPRLAELRRLLQKAATTSSRRGASEDEPSAVAAQDVGAFK